MGRDERWDTIANQVVQFAEWWKEHRKNYSVHHQEKEAIALMAFKAGYEAGSDDGFIEGQEDMLECGYELPHNPQED